MIHPDLPLVELHRHLDGSVRLETILDLGLQHNLSLPAFSLEGLRSHVQVSSPQPGVMAFIDKFKWMLEVMVDYEAIRRIAFENVADAQQEGLDYVELRFSPMFMASAHGLNLYGVVESVIDGIQLGRREFGIGVNIIGILSRTYGVASARVELNSLLEYSNHIRALDLAGDEVNFPAEWFREYFKEARDAGWHITVHAGESASANSIWQAIRMLGAERIGHALHAIEDPDLLDYMAEHCIAIESCLTSNVQTSCVPDYVHHPLRLFLEHGIRATINTDDPGISAITLPYEYNTAAPAAGLTRAQIYQAQGNALEAAFLTAEEQQELRAKHTRMILGDEQD